MLNSLSSFAHTTDLGVDRALMGLDLAHERMQADRNESVMMAHIRKLERDLKTKDEKYNGLVRIANERINLLKDEVLRSHADIEQLQKEKKTLGCDVSMYGNLIKILEEKLRDANAKLEQNPII